LGNLTRLVELNLCARLNSIIPPELGNLTGLVVLDLSDNRLSGSIPPELGNLVNLVELHLEKNSLSGSIPPELGNLTNLYLLYIYRNNLSGSIPPELGNLTKLRQFYLQSNCLSGFIPCSLQNLVNLIHHDGDPWINRGLNICWNALYTRNPDLRKFIEYYSHPYSCSWVTTQTLPPWRIFTSPVSAHAVELKWRPVVYQEDPGCYRVFYSTSEDGPFQFFGETADKLSTSMTVDGLETGVTYYFKVQTRTYPHENNKYTVDSNFSHIAVASTFQKVIPISGIVTCNGVRLAGVTLTLSNHGGTFTTDADGYYIATVKPGWSGKITPTKKNYRFKPVFRTYTKVSAEKIDQDFKAVSMQ
jgi:hypothetical protein